MIKLKVEQSVIINLPAEEIFAYMCDFENLVEWSSVVIAVRRTSPGAMRVGTTVQCTIRFLGRWLDLTYEIVECEPGRLLTLKSISGIAPCFFCYRFEPVEGDRTRVSEESVIQLTGGFLGLAESVLTSAARRQIDHDLLTLKDLLEARTSISSNAS